MSADAIPLSEADMATLQKNLVKAEPPVRRKLIGGPLNGQEVIIPPAQLTNDVGWWTMHYVLQTEGAYPGMMVWSRKE